MVVLEKSPKLAQSESKAELRIERTDITFGDLPEGLVRVQLILQNIGTGRSVPTTMRLESAPLGAFVPWSRLTQLVVPALEPGESRQLSTEVVRPNPTPLGDFNRVPPKRILTALSAASAPQSGGGLAALLGLLARPSRPSHQSSAGRPSLAPDLWDLVGRSQPYWAGNINVFVSNQAIERHLARALRIYPGRLNLAMFIVGGGGRDAFSFELAGLAQNWKARLYDLGRASTLEIKRNTDSLKEGEWVETPRQMMVILAVEPPSDCRTGNLEVHVTRRSSQKSAVVEFNLDPAAQGSGCYCA